LFADAMNQKVASELCVELLQTFAVTLQRLALTDDKPRSASHCTNQPCCCYTVLRVKYFVINWW